MLRRITFLPRRTLASALLFLSMFLSLFAFQGVALAAATPTALLNVVPSVQIGADFSFTVTFDNTGTNTGYGPFVDLILPVTGADGAGAALDDGTEFSGATYQGQPVVATQLTFPPGVAPTATLFTLTKNYLTDKSIAIQKSVANVNDTGAAGYLVTRGQTGRLIGGCVPPGGTGGPPPDCSFNDGPTTGMLVFRTIIRDRFTDAYPSGDPPVDSGDRLDNAVTISGDVLNDATLAPTGLAEADTSAAGLAMVIR